MIRIPGTVGWKQTNRSNLRGTLWSTFNIDLLENLGALRVSPRMKLNTSTADDAELAGAPVGFKRFFNTMWTVAGSHVFRAAGGTPEITWTQDTSTSTPTDCSSSYSDVEVFDGRIWVTTTDELLSKSDTGTNAWTSKDTLTASKPHMMKYFLKFDRLYTLNGTSIRSIGTDDVVAAPGADYAISIQGEGLDNSIHLSCIDVTNEAVWAGTLTDDPRGVPSGGVFEWDGISAQPTKFYPIKGASGVLALRVKENVPHAMDSNGIWYKFNGTAFVEEDRLPFETVLPVNQNALTNTRFIHPNGLLATKNGTVLALISNTLGNSSGSYLENMPAGIWEWIPGTGFVHRMSLSYTPVAGSTITDYGQMRLSGVGGLADMNWYSTGADRNGTLLAGASYYTDATSSSHGIFLDDSNDTLQKYGSFVTTKILAERFEETWQDFWVRHKRLLDSSDSVVVKYRTTEGTPVEITITWTSATTFTTTTDVSGYVGYEVEVLNGKGAGMCAHISSVSHNAGTYTVTVDDSFTGATSGTAKARLQAWNKLLSQTSQSLDWASVGIGATSTWIQLKVCMRFKGKDELYDIIIDNEKHL